MNCKNCNSPLEEGAVFCSNCGTKVVNDVTPVTEENKEVVNNTVETPVVQEPVEKPVVQEPVESSVPPVMPTPIVEPQISEAASTVNESITVEKKSKAPIVVIIIVLSILLLVGLGFALFKFVLPKIVPEPDTPVVEQTKEETIDIGGYTYTIPSVFSEFDVNDSKAIGNEYFYFKTENAKTVVYSYSEIVDSKNEIASELTKTMPTSMTYLGANEETFAGQKYLIYRASFLIDSKTYYSDVIFTELPDKIVFRTTIQYDPDYKNTGYTNLTSFIKSAKLNKASDDESTTNTTSDDYMVIGSDTVGYLKLPGKDAWMKGNVYGSTNSSIQYFEKASFKGSTSTGSWIVTLDVLDKTKYTDAKSSASAFETAWANDSDTTNIKAEKDKIGKYDAYKVFVQYKSDNVWVVSWFFKADDDLIHMIQVEGLDIDNDYFKIPKTFSLTKIN